MRFDLPILTDRDNQRLAASATLFIEYKFIRGCGKVEAESNTACSLGLTMLMFTLFARLT